MMRKRFAVAGLALYLLWEAAEVFYWGGRMVASGDAAPLGLLITYQRQFVAMLLALIALLIFAIKKRLNPVLGIITFLMLPLYLSYWFAVNMLNVYAMHGTEIGSSFLDYLPLVRYLLLFVGLPYTIQQIRRQSG
jgi:Ca2+/Na+ antiporter